MRFAAAFLIFFLTACASSRSGPGPAPIETRGPAQFSLTVGALTVDQALAHLGPAQVDRREGRGALLTWKRRSCALTLVFAQDRAGQLRLADAAASDAAKATPVPPETCAGQP